MRFLFWGFLLIVFFEGVLDPSVAGTGVQHGDSNAAKELAEKKRKKQQTAEEGGCC